MYVPNQRLWKPLPPSCGEWHCLRLASLSGAGNDCFPPEEQGISMQFITFSLSYCLEPQYVPLLIWHRFSSFEVWATRILRHQLIRLLILTRKNLKLGEVTWLAGGHTVEGGWTQLWNPLPLESGVPALLPVLTTVLSYNGLVVWIAHHSSPVR